MAEAPDNKGKEVVKPKPVAKNCGKSPVWKFFTAPFAATGGKNAGKQVVTCVVPMKEGAVCGHQMIYQNSTTALGNHLSLVHSAFIAKVCLIEGNSKPNFSIVSP